MTRACRRPPAAHPCLRYHFQKYGPEASGNPTHSRLRSLATRMGRVRLGEVRTSKPALA